METEAWDITTPEELQAEAAVHVEEDDELATVEELRADVEALQKALRKIANLDPTRIGTQGGVTHKHFGKKIILALEKAKSLAGRAHYEQQARDYVRVQKANEAQAEGESDEE